MAWLTELGAEGVVVELTDATVRVGRAADNDVVIAADFKVSRNHLQFLVRNGSWWVRDCESRNGTFVNGNRVTEVILQRGDEIRIGSRQFVFTDDPDPRATLTEDRLHLVAPPAAMLSAREKEVVALVAAGATDGQIARRLNVGLSTVHSHLDRVRDKTGRRRRPDLTRLATELGLDIPEL